MRQRYREEMGRQNVKDTIIHEKETTPFHVLFCKNKHDSQRASQESMRSKKKEVSEKVS